MREILFRGKRIGNNSWVYGGIMETFHPNFDSKNTKDFFENKPNCYCICANNRDHFVQQNTIGQYAGLTDKNGNKIFEGDILKGLCGTYIVFFDEDFACFDWKEINDNLGENFSGFADEYKIIGNIHDNPELLKGGAE